MRAPAPGPAGLRPVLRSFIAAFPDVRIHLDQVIGEGETVATRGRFTGTHKGAFMGVAATGKPVSANFVDFWRLRDGKAVENWVQMDLLGLMQQLGAIRSPAR